MTNQRSLLLLLGGAVGRTPEDQGAHPPAKLADGVYAVQRDGLKEMDLLAAPVAVTA